MDEGPDAALDNDVLIKLTAYDLLGAAQARLGAVGMLGAARYVVRSALERHRGLQDREAAKARWEASLDTIAFLEPNDGEIRLATHLEESAAATGLPLDGGESQLCAMTITRGIAHLVTGDKRAIAAAEVMTASVAELLALAGRVLCLEQLTSHLVEDLGAENVRRRICSEAGADRSLSICLSCAGLESGSEFDPAGLTSYAESVRATAPTLLWKDDS